MSFYLFLTVRLRQDWLPFVLLIIFQIYLRVQSSDVNIGLVSENKSRNGIDANETTSKRCKTSIEVNIHVVFTFEDIFHFQL